MLVCTDSFPKENVFSDVSFSFGVSEEVGWQVDLFQRGTKELQGIGAAECFGQLAGFPVL